MQLNNAMLWLVKSLRSELCVCVVCAHMCVHEQACVCCKFMYVRTHLCACTCLYLSVYVCGVCAHTVCLLPCVLMWRLQDKVKCLVLLFFVLLFETRAISRKLAIVTRAQLVGQRATGTNLSLSTTRGRLGVYSFICGCLGIKFGSSWLDRKPYYPLTHLPRS